MKVHVEMTPAQVRKYWRDHAPQAPPFCVRCRRSKNRCDCGVLRFLVEVLPSERDDADR